MQEHTPGPWKATRSHEGFHGPYFPIDEEDRDEYDARSFVRIESAEETVAAAHDLFEFKEANARLIAAAPQLLEAAKAVIGDLQHYASTHGPGPDRRLAALLDAIMSAEGER